MRVSELQFDLPPELIAQRPIEPRDASRLLVLDRAGVALRERVFREIDQELRAGDLLVVNDTQVVPARFFARRSTGGRIEAFFLNAGGDRWRVLLSPSARLKVGERLRVEVGEHSSRPTGAVDVALELVERRDRGEWIIRPEPPTSWLSLLHAIGQTPLPPYIHRDGAPDERDRQRYQTVYAERPGAVAAPTAGLHFTPELLQRLRAVGVGLARVTLHVGLGTFATVDAEDLNDHRMHAEWYEVSAETLSQLRAARSAGGRIVAVGTTSCRVLESIELASSGPLAGWTSILIQPPYRTRNVDALITNFHLPGSTLIALVMAIAGVERIRGAYRHAVDRGYRFFSYGDAMLIV